MGGLSEREFSEKIVKVKEKVGKVSNEVRDDFAKMEKLKADSLRKIEEMRRDAEKDLEKLESESVKSKDIAPESLRRINGEITDARYQIQRKYQELKERVSASITPT